MFSFLSRQLGGRLVLRRSLIHQRNSSSGPSSGGNTAVTATLGLAGAIGAATFAGYYVTSRNRKRTNDLRRNSPNVKYGPPAEDVTKDLPAVIPYVIIGAGTAAFAAARTIKSNDPNARVLIIGEEAEYPYMRPPLSKELWYTNDDALVNAGKFKLWSGNEKSIFYQTPEYFTSISEFETAPEGAISLLRGFKVVSLNPQKKAVMLSNGLELSYGKCLLATGSEPHKLEGVQSTKIVTYRNLADFRSLAEKTKTIKSVAIIGGGFLGPELANGLHIRYPELEVHLISKSDGLISNLLPKYLSQHLTDILERSGIKLRKGVTVVNTKETRKGGVELELSDKSRVTADLVIVATGASPRVELANNAGLELDATNGGVVTNTELEVRSDLWAAGDVASYWDVRFGRRRVEHHDHAVVSGRLAGENMTGAKKPYWHQALLWCDIGEEIGFEAVGVCDAKLETYAVFNTPESEASADTPRTPPYDRGIVFYLRENLIVGILLWNLFGQMRIAREILEHRPVASDVEQIAKFFVLYPTPLTTPDEILETEEIIEDTKK